MRERVYTVEARGSAAVPGVPTYPTRREASEAAIRSVRYRGDVAAIGSAASVEQRGVNVYLSEHRVLRVLTDESPFVRRARAGLLPSKVLA